MNFMLTCVKCNREFDGSATNADHIRSLCCLCNDQDVVVGDGSSEDNEDVSEELDSDTENVAAQDDANDLVPEPPHATIPIVVVPDNYVGVKSGEEIGHLLLTAMKGNAIRANLRTLSLGNMNDTKSEDPEIVKLQELEKSQKSSKV